MSIAAGDVIGMVTSGLFKSSSGSCDYPAVGDVESGVSYGSGAYTGTFAVPAASNVRSGIQYGAGGTEFTGTYAWSFTSSATDMLTRVKDALISASQNGLLKDGNIPVRNIWQDLDWVPENRKQLPIVLFDEINGGASRYAANEIELIPFAVKFIVWIETPADRPSAESRARLLRESVINALYTARPFSGAGGARQGMRIDREVDAYNVRFAVGLGFTVYGDLFDSAGV